MEKPLEPVSAAPHSARITYLNLGNISKKGLEPMRMSLFNRFRVAGPKARNDQKANKQTGNSTGRIPLLRRGTTAVEFALVGPIFILMVLAIIEFGRTFMVMELLTDSARIGCRQGILEGTSNQQITDAAVNFLNSVGISGQTVQVIVNDAAGNSVEAQNMPAYTEITVLAQISVSQVTWLPVAGMQIFIPGVGSVSAGPTGTLTGQFTMRRE
jgi:Flp pilus assembly protein TadG